MSGISLQKKNLKQFINTKILLNMIHILFYYGNVVYKAY